MNRTPADRQCRTIKVAWRRRCTNLKGVRDTAHIKTYSDESTELHVSKRVGGRASASLELGDDDRAAIQRPVRASSSGGDIVEISTKQGTATALLVPAVVAAIVCGGVVHVLHRQEAVFCNGVMEGLDQQGELRPLSDVVTLTKSLNLITVEIESSVRVEQQDTNWRGTATATLETPVRYLYGVDLAKLEHSSFKFLPLLQTYQIRVPLPRRLAAEVFTGNPTIEEIKSTGFRPRAGAMQMTMARRALHEQACRQVLSAELAERVCDQSKEQIEAVVRQFVGGSCRVEVSFAEGE